MIQVEANLELPRWRHRLDEMYTHPWRTIVLHGGRGAGAKSRTVAQWLTLRIAATGERWLCTREFQKSIKTSVHQLLKECIVHAGLSDAYTVSDRSISCANGGEFIFEGLHANVEQIKSMQGLNGCWVEEAETVSESSWLALLPTIREKGSKIIITLNPRDPDDATIVRFLKRTPGDCLVLKLTQYEDQPGDGHNPFFANTELEAQLRHDYRVDPDGAAHVWGGEFRKNAIAQIFAGKYRVEEFEPANDWDGPWFGLDFGFARDPLSAHKYWGKGNTAYVEHEAWGIGVELNDIPGVLRRYLPGLGHHVVRADCSRPESISHLQGLGVNVVAAEKWPGSVEDGIAYLRSLDEIVIHPRCVNACTEARMYAYKTSKTKVDANGQPLVLAEPEDSWNHFWDDMRYAFGPAIKANEHVITLSHEERVQITPELDDFEAQFAQV